MMLALLTGCGGDKHAQDSSLADLEIGDVIYYGSYLQSTSEPEPIQWRMVDKDGGFGLFVAEYILDCHAFNDENKDTSYADSDLRKWLNDDFIKTAFDREHRKFIRPEAVFDHDNKDREDNKDKIFVLSRDEAEKYFPSESDRLAYPTNYAVGRGAIPFDVEARYGEWWLRDNGSDGSHALCVTIKGFVPDDGHEVDYAYTGVRPAMWLRLGNWPKGHGPTF